MSRIRTFIAVDPGRAVRDRLVELQQDLGRAGRGMKWVEPENLHVTLLFLGEVDDREVPDVCRAVTDSCAARDAFVLTVAGVGCFGSPRRPRTVWAGLTGGAPELVALHDALEPPLMELGCYRREDRPFTPHLTLGRVQGGRVAAGLGDALLRFRGWRGGSTEVHEVLVMSSELRPAGPVYTVLSRAKLRPPPPSAPEPRKKDEEE
jgi:2'-5' RNA ligase